MEFYFSDTNLPTDNYLMKFVKKDPEGFGMHNSPYLLWSLFSTCI